MGWTVAYRKTNANRFLRVDGVSLDWDAATELAVEVSEALGEGHQVYYVTTRQDELDGRVCEEDIANLLVDSGRRVRMVEGGVLPEGVHVEGYERPVKVRKPRPLGTEQQGVLEALLRHGVYYPGSGWYWGNTSTTKRIMDSLVARGLATVETFTVPTRRDGVKSITQYRPIR
jgi:hypothetical protein